MRYDSLKNEKSGRTRLYSKESIFHLKKLWHILDNIFSKKMQAALTIWLDFTKHQISKDQLRKNYSQ